MEDLFKNDPDSLFDITISFVAKSLHKFLILDVDEDAYYFKDRVAFPSVISERIFEEYQKYHCMKDDVLNSFLDTNMTPMTNVKLKNGKISDKCFEQLVSRKPQNLVIGYCNEFDEDFPNNLRKYSENLVNLKLLCIPSDAMAYKNRHFDLRAPKLKRLILNEFFLGSFPIKNVNMVNQLTYLDLSESYVADAELPNMPNLESLILFNTGRMHELFNWIYRLPSLKHLDISKTELLYDEFLRPNLKLAKLIANLPLLEYLDVSGTNLAGTGVAARVNMEVMDDELHLEDLIPLDIEDCSTRAPCDVPGLAERVNRPLKFFGLYGSPHGACKRHHIPAEVVSGNANEQQILSAAKAFLNRPALLRKVLNDLYYLFRNDKIDSIWIPLDMVLTAMEAHPRENHIQIAGSATLFYVVKGNDCANITGRLLQRVILVVLHAMENHPSDGTIMRNCCLTICQFNVPTDVLFVYNNLVTALISGILMASEVFMMRIGTYLLNSLACQVDQIHKVYLGDNGIMRCMLQIINDRLSNDVCDDIMAMAWSTMWNVTDETPKNCQLFLEDVGLYVFQSCLTRYPEKPELLRNMMGLLGNVAEVAQLRPNLMDSDLIILFDNLLDSQNDGIEVSYNAAGVLSHLASDGVEAWILDKPDRNKVLEHIATAIDQWNLRSERNINYRSFGPILALIRASHTPQCQLWAVWALANLTTMYPDKYCMLLDSEGGLDLLNTMLESKTITEKMRDLAKMVMHNCFKYMSTLTE